MNRKEEKMNDYIMIKVTAEFKEQLKKEARERGLTLSGYIKAIIAERKK
jgi:hypothetical protein